MTRAVNRVGSSQVFISLISSAPVLVFHLAHIARAHTQAQAHMPADTYSWFVVVAGLKNKASADGCFSARAKRIYSSVTMVTNTHTHTHVYTHSLCLCLACPFFLSLCVSVMFIKSMIPSESVTVLHSDLQRAAAHFTRTYTLPCYLNEDTSRHLLFFM